MLPELEKKKKGCIRETRSNTEQHPTLKAATFTVFRAFLTFPVLPYTLYKEADGMSTNARRLVIKTQG